jgi:DNA-binding CsgD family transcriptional regulator
MGLTRELATSRMGTWASTLFVYQAARFGFRPSEQRLLLTALLGGTDEDIADHLSISRSAVKKAWHSIYERVATRDPELIPCGALIGSASSERGKGKKQRLIAYLRDHPEELRPARDT